jgi:L-amino acid N-acyltransferase YncA
MMSKAFTPKRAYPWTTEIKNKQVTFRLFGRDDKDAALQFARQLPEEDLLFLTFDITNPNAMEQWVRSIEDNKAVTVLAEINGQFVGYGSLTYNQLQWTRHLGEIRLMVSRDYRGYGLGKLLVNEIFELSQELGLQKLVAQMASEQRGAVQVFEHLDFKPEALLADHVIDRNDVTHDLIIMSHDMRGFTE